MTDRYEIAFDFDCEGEPPHVEIYDNGTATERGGVCLEVHEEPTQTAAGEYSWEDDDWEPGPLAKRIVRLLNGGN